MSIIGSIAVILEIALAGIRSIGTNSLISGEDSTFLTSNGSGYLLSSDFSGELLTS